MNNRVTIFFLFLLLGFGGLSARSMQNENYYFRTIDIKNGLSQNSVYQIIQDRKGFMWFGTKDGLNRYDGVTCQVYKKENSDLGRNFITALYEDRDGDIWIGTDGGVFIYHPMFDSFEPFTVISDDDSQLKDYVTMIKEDEEGNIWFSVENQGFFCYRKAEKKLYNYLKGALTANLTRFWFTENKVWLSLYEKNLYSIDRNLNGDLVPYKDSEGNEIFEGDVINWQIDGPHNCSYIGSMRGLYEINMTSGKSRKLLDVYVRTLQFRSDNELWVGTENGLYVINLRTNKLDHLTVPEQDDMYSLSDKAIYSLWCDKEKGMWIGSYFGGVNYSHYQWTYFAKFYPQGNMDYLGRRVREFCKANDGTLWIGTEDKGLFNYNPATGVFKPFEHPDLYKNIHGLCLDGDYLWVGTFSGGLNRINLKNGTLKHFQKGFKKGEFPADNAFSVCKISTGDTWIGTTSGLIIYNWKTEEFTVVDELKYRFIYDIEEDFNGNVWLATFSNGVFCYNVRTASWTNYVHDEKDSTSLPYNKVIGIFEDSSKRLWFTTLGEGFCRYNPKQNNFVRYDISDGFPSNTVYKIVEDKRGRLWLSSNYGLTCFDTENNIKHIYTTANGLLSNQFNFQSGYSDVDGKIYMGCIKGFIAFDPETFVENDFLPPVVITDFELFNKRISVSTPNSPLTNSIVYSQGLELDYDQNSFTFHVAALSYQAPEMNQLLYKLDGFDKEWIAVGKNPVINYSHLPYGSYQLRITGSNSDRKWNPEERRLNILINPPFYLSSWAYAIYILLFIVLSGLSIYSLKRRSQRRHLLLMDKFEREKEKELYTAKFNFFTNVAHEIRTPLTLIKSPLENVLHSEHLTEEVKDNLEIMDLNANRLLDLVNQLLDFSKTETKGLKLNIVKCELVDIFKKTCKRFLPLAKNKGLELQAEIPEKLEAMVDKEGLIKIFSNLLTNAIKYSDTYIHMKLYLKDNQVVFEEENDGIPVPHDMKDKIFEPFIQYRIGKLSTVPGTGIGLALARSLAELHGGTLQMDDSEDVNRFILRLPTYHENSLIVDHSEVEWMEQQQVEITDNRTANTDLHFTLLLVEDSIEMLHFVKKLFMTEYHVLTATNGVEAIEVLKENSVNLIISDVMMPEMDGLELCQRIKSDLEYSHIPIVLLTAKTTLQSKIEGMKVGADVYIEKPFSIEYLKVCIANLLENREKLRSSFVNSPFVETNTMALTKADETFLKNMNEVVLSNIQNSEFCLDDLSAALNMSRSSLNRKIKGLLDMTPNDYIRLERLKKAAQLLKEGECKINEVCYMVGFNTPSYFTKCFQKQFGVLPKDFIKE